MTSVQAKQSRNNKKQSYRICVCVVLWALLQPAQSSVAITTILYLLFYVARNIKLFLPASNA